MGHSTADRALLFGYLALQMDFITSPSLVSAMNAWALGKDKSLGQVLVSRGDLAEDDDALIEALARRIIEKHENNPRRGLEAVTALAAVPPELEQIADDDLGYSVRMLPNLGETTWSPIVANRPCSSDDRSSPGARFRLVKFHARGGIGEVWIAEDTELHRRVALKQLRERFADDPWSQIRFVHEAEVTGALEHRGIAPVYGLGRLDNGRPFYAMRFIGGTRLKDAIDKFHETNPSPHPDDRSMELRRLLARFVDVCNTVAYAHSRGVLHRDLKPENIIIDEYGETLVVDWGLAKLSGREVEPLSTEPVPHPVTPSELPCTVPGMKMGTAAFMSPEQSAGLISELGPATDVYSLGATLYCLLTGKSPFDEKKPTIGEKKPTIGEQVCAGDFPRPRQVVSGVPIALEAICLKAMALNPPKRYSTARALGEDIELWLADQPVLAYPEPFPQRVARWIRRRKQWVAAAAVLLVLTVLGLTVLNAQIRQEKAKTTDQLGMTRDALRELYTVSGENLAVIPNTEKLREHLAELVLDRYQQLRDKFPSDFGIRLETALVLRVIGGIERSTGQFTKSRESYRKAIDELTTLCQEDPGQADYRRWLVETLVDRGELYHMNDRSSDAENDFHAASDQAEPLLKRPVLASDHRRAKASALINLSEILTLKNQHSEARKTANEAVDLLKPLVVSSADPNRMSRNRWLLAMALTDRGIACGEEGDDANAAGDFDEAAKVASQILRGDEVYDDAQFQLASIANQRGELLSKDHSKLAESERNFEEASLILSRLINDHKPIAHYREEMTLTLVGRAVARLAMDRSLDADSDCQAALDLVSRLIEERTRSGAPESAQYRSLLGRILALQSQIRIRQGRPRADGRETLAQAAENLTRAIQIDSAREKDQARLEQIRNDLGQIKE